MEYILAKELNDAGFPYESDFRAVKMDGTVVAGGVEDETDVLIPTLSELIEACGDDFFELVKDSNRWLACKFMGVFELGTTPEDAVARLWLEINKK